MNPSSSQAASQRYHPIFGSSPEHPSSSQRQLARTQSGASASRPPQRPLSMHNGARPRLPQTTQRARIPSSQRPQASGDSVIDAITLDSSSEDEARPVVRNIAPSTGSTQRPRPSSSRPPVPRRSSVRPVVSATASDDEIVFEREIPAPQRSTTRAPASASQARPSPAMPAASQAGPSRLPVSGSHEARGRADKGEGQPVGTSRQEIPTSSKEDGSAGPPRSGGMASAERFTGRSLVVPDSTPPTSHTSKEGYAPSQAAAGPSAQRPPVRLLVVSNSASSASSTPRAASSPEKQSSPQRQIQRSGAAPAGVPGGGGGFGRPSDSIPRGMLATTSRPTTPSAHGMERTLSFRLGNGSTASERRQALMDPSVRPSGSNISPMRMPKGEPSPSPLKRQKLASDSRSHTTQASPTKRFDRATNIASTASSRPHANSHRPASARSAQIPYTPLSGTLSNLSSTSSQSDTAASARSQSRQEQLDAIRARSKKAAEAAYPLSDVSVSLSPSQKKRRREEKYGSDKKPKNKDKKDRKDKVKAMLEAGPSGSGSGATSGSRTPSESSGAAAKAFAASPLKQTTKRMSSPVVQHGEQEADEESDPLDARNRSEGARSGVDLVEEMRKSSPSYMNAEEDAQAAQAGDGAAGTQAVAEQVSDPNKDVEEEEIDLLAMWDHLADIVVSPPTPPPAPSPLPTHSEPERALMRASTPDPKLPTMPPTSIQPATPNRPTARMDPYKTFSAIGEVSPAAARFKRHASLSPNVSMSQLPRTRGLSLSKADGSISSIASALVSATQRTADDPTLKTLLKQGSEQDKSTPPVSAPKKRTLADIMREQEEEEADLQRRHERALDWDEEEEEESDSGAESGTQNDEVPASGSMEDTESGGSRLMKVDGQIRRTSGRLRGMPSVALTALREDDDVTAARTEHSSATQAVATAEPVLPDYVPPNAEDAQLPDATADAMAANALDPVSEQAGLDAVAGLLEGGEDAPVAADVLREIATSTDQLDKAWEGLWADKEWKCSGVSVDRELAVPDLEGCGWLLPLLQLASAGNIRPLLTVLATGACTEVLDAQDGVGPCDMLQYVIDIALSGAAISEFAFSTALSMIKTANTNPFASSRGLIGKVSYTLGTLGLRPEMQSIFPRHECPDDACDAGCGWRIRYRTKGVGMMAMIVAVSAEVRWIEAAHAVQLAKLFLFLCIDPSTCTASCVSLQEALHQLWPLCLEDMAAPGLAIFICEHARHLPHLAQRDLLSAIGSASSQALEIARWTGMELLLPRSLEKLPSHTIHVVPHLNMIIDGTTAILENVVDRECDTDHGLLATQIEAFCAAMNDLQHMVTVHPGKTSNVERGFRLVVKHLKQACDAIRRGPSTGRLELYNKLRLSQLASIIDQQLERPLAKRSRAAQQAKLKKKGLVLGDASKGANQTRLDFVKLPMTRGDQWVAGGRDSGDETRGQEGAGHGEPASEGEGRSPGDVDVGTAAADPAKGLATPTTANNKAAPSNVETNSLRMSEQPPAIPPTHTLPSPAASNPSTPAATQDQYITPSASPEPSPPPSAIVTPANDVLAETYDGVTREAITDTGRPTCTSPLNNRRSNDPSKPIPSASPERRQRSLSASIGHKVADAAKYVARKAGMGRLLTPPTEEQMASIPGSPAGAQAGQAEAGAAEASGAGSGGGGGGGDGGAGAGKTLRIPPTMKPRQRVPSDLLPSFGSAVPAGPLSASSTVKWGFGPRM